MRSIAILLLTQIAVFSQPAKLEEFSVIEGRVLNSTTGDPLAKAALTLSRIDQKSEQANWEQSYAVTSDASGKFLIRNIRPGRYRLRAKRNGFMDAEYGAHGPQQSGTVLDLNHPQQIKDLELRLSQQGVIAGRILDADGEPMYGATVHLLRSRYAGGRKVVVATNLFGTNDLGEYRFPGLPPGKYYVFVQAGKIATPLSEIHEEYVPAYYPGSVDFLGAVSLDVLPGSQIRASDLLMRKEHTVTVRGRVVVNVPAIDRIMPVYITRNIGHENSTGNGLQATVATVNSAGEFEAHGVTPGSYIASVAVAKTGGGYSGSVKLDVGASDVESVVITVDTGITVTGRIVAEGETKAGEVKGTAERAANWLSSPQYRTCFTSQWDDPVAKDQTFRVPRMSPDIYGVEMSNLPDGFYIKRIRAGNVDATYTGIDIRSGANDPIEVLLSAKAGVVSGVVQNTDRNEAAPGATVVLIPKETERLTISRYYPQATTDQYGRFTLKNVPPGDYKAFAWEDVESTAWMDPEFMSPLKDKGLPVTVAESGQSNVQVPLITVRQK